MKKISRKIVMAVATLATAAGLVAAAPAPSHAGDTGWGWVCGKDCGSGTR